MQIPPALDQFGSDLRFGCRQLWRSPLFTAVAAATLALGIAGTTAIFSVVYAVILQPLPLPQPDRLVAVGEDFQRQLSSASAGNFNDWRTRSRSFSELAAFQFASFNLAHLDEPERVLGARTTRNLFAAYGVNPQLGRTYSADEDRPGGATVVVLSHRLWVRRFGGDPDVVGTTVRMDGRPFTIVGVMPAALDRMALPEELWVPIAFTPERLAEHDNHELQVVGRLADGVSVEQAVADLAGITAQVRNELPQEHQVRGAVVAPLAAQLVGSARERLLILFGAVTFVLLIACANVAHLLLARGGVRVGEIALRSALGATRVRIVWQLLTETFVLALLGGALGVLLAYWAVPILVRWSPAGTPRLDQADVNLPVLAFALLAATMCAMVAGLVPALATARLDLRSAQHQGTRTFSVSRERLRSAIIAAEVGVSLVLLVGAGLLVRSAVHLQQVEHGFDIAHVLRARMTLPSTGYEDPARVVRAYTELVQTLQSSPEVEAAAVSSTAPLGNEGNSNGLVPEGKAFDPNDFVLGRLGVITSDYFRVLGIPVIAGRTFGPDDRRGAPLVAVLSETAARQLFPGQNAIGKRFWCCEATASGEPVHKVVVGIVGDVRSRGPQADPLPDFYLPIEQAPADAWTWLQRSMTVVARSRTDDPASLAGVVRESLRKVDPTVPLDAVATMGQRLRATMAESRFNTALMLLLALVGLVLSAVGLYGVISYFVVQRLREFAIRIALGASSRSVMCMVLGQAMRPVALGVAAGTMGAFVVSRALSSYVFGIGARDPLTLAAAVSVLAAVAAAAALLPARRAARTDPARTLAANS